MICGVWHAYFFYLQDNFDVDHFVSECRKHVQLETLRDDLELYYKLLKTAMVELINKDYADFVNLSTNLVKLFKLNVFDFGWFALPSLFYCFLLQVGMDKALNHLTVPLGQLREEVMVCLYISYLLFLIVLPLIDSEWLIERYSFVIKEIIKKQSFRSAHFTLTIDHPFILVLCCPNFSSAPCIRCNLQRSISMQTSTSFGCATKPEHLEETHPGTGRTPHSQQPKSG